MIATAANREFRRLYEVDDVSQYSAYKASIFARYRTLAEMIGILLLKVRVCALHTCHSHSDVLQAAKEKRMNCLLEVRISIY